MPSVTGTLRCLSHAVRWHRRTIQLGSSVCILFLNAALSGCALYQTYEKCGFRGCPGDAIITADVVWQLDRCSFMEPNAVNVQTIDHVVYLNGVVRSSLEISTAESIADQVPGVTRVVNSMVAFTR
jgi:hypothetical protein